MYRVKEKRKKIGIQVGCSSVDHVERGVQCSNSKSSYGRKEKKKGIMSHSRTFAELGQVNTILVERRGFYCVKTTMWYMSVGDEVDGV